MKTGRIAPLFACLALAAATAFVAAPAAGQTTSGDASASNPSSSSDADASASPFWTKYAYFVPSRFGDLPGWRNDDLRDAWKAFRQTCSVLAGRSAWFGPCARSSAVRPNDSDDVRRYLEREFTLYQIHNKDRSADGVITGYYEPLLNGSRRHGQGFVYPVYGVPDDLLYLDSRSIPDAVDGSPIFARLDGRNVIPLCADRTGCIGPYVLDLGDAKPDIRDKKLRVRLDGARVVPYFTRTEIERGALPDRHVILWVNDLAALYSMQVQGSGKVRMPDGQIVRLAFGEQNGHPFNPPVRAARKSTRNVLTRGIALPDNDIDDVLTNAERTAALEMVSGAEPTAAPEVLTRGIQPASNSPPPPAPPPPATPTNATGDEAMSPEVARMVEMLLKGTGSTAQPVLPAAAQAPPKSRPETVAVARPAPVIEARPTGGYFSPGAQSAFSSDPSYVFFRQIPDSEQGPVGALGVPLTAGRSLAVDPRTTPLGFPVFISTGGQLNRLMLAQDTGGAIRGPVRADYFWGFGPNAYEQASRMKENGRMWLLLPKALAASVGTGGVVTRSISRGAGPNDVECLVADPDFCVE